MIVLDTMAPAAVDALAGTLEALGFVPERLTHDPVYRSLVLAPLARVRGLELDAVLISAASRRFYPETPHAGRHPYIAPPRPPAGGGPREAGPRRSHESMVSDWPALEPT